MLETALPIADLYWEGERFRPSTDGLADDPPARLDAYEGQFALAGRDGDRVWLARDRYGINKLFYAVREGGGVVASNFISDLTGRGVPFEAIYSVPAGHVTVVDTAARRLTTTRYHDPPGEGSLDAQAGAAGIRAALERWFARLARDLGDREIYLCLSGGLDSSLIAALACRHFERVQGFTYSFVDARGELSEDAHYARIVADHLGMPLELIRADGNDIAGVLDDALIDGQDWRDFNVHCAVVNALLGRAMAAFRERRGDEAPLVLTGDMMNEILADYTPITFRGVEYYSLPDVGIEMLRRILIRGLDAGDREIGVFRRKGLDALQPFGLVLEEYLALPIAELGEEAAKQQLVRLVADDLLPEEVLGRTKVRAQIGTSAEPTGILPLFADRGWDAAWLRARWAERHGVDDPRRLDRFMRFGVYRMPARYPGEKGSAGGYLVG